MRTWDLDDLVATGDLARERGISAAAATNWRLRYPDFPKPLVELSSGPVYSRRQVEQWQRHRWPEGHPSLHKVRRPLPKPNTPRRYATITADLRARIVAGEWPLGARLPSRVVLAREYGVAAGSIARPIAELCAEGLLTTKPSSGTYVTRPEE